jgi:hypothetical protein
MAFRREVELLFAKLEAIKTEFSSQRSKPPAGRDPNQFNSRSKRR